MKDTTSRVEEKFRSMLLQRSGEERLKMGCSIHATSRALVKASMSEKDPIALKRALFLRFYGDGFEPGARKRVLRALRKAAEHNGKSNLRTVSTFELRPLAGSGVAWSPVKP